MIVSHQHHLAFLHNPKVGGTSVRATIEHLHDDETVFWDTDPATPDMLLDRAHLGLDEIAETYPALWDKMRHYKLFCLYRDPVGRFFSSLAEYSKLHGETDTRFADAATRKRVLMELVQELERFGHAEALMPEYRFRHFRPQWIYWRSETVPDLDMTALPVSDVPGLFDAIAQHTGAPLHAQTRNRGDQLDLPGPLARLAASRSIKNLARNLPGISAVKSALRARFAASGTPQERYGLTDTDYQQITEFVTRLYARDLAFWPDGAAASKISS